MNVIEPVKTENLVRADLIAKEKGLRCFCEEEGNYDYFIVLDTNAAYYLVLLKPGLVLSYDYLWVFNVKTGTLATIPTDRMVEPVELEVIVKEKE